MSFAGKLFLQETEEARRRAPGEQGRQQVLPTALSGHKVRRFSAFFSSCLQNSHKGKKIRNYETTWEWSWGQLCKSEILFIKYLEKILVE